MWNKRQAGVTLIELIVAIVIVGVALAGMVAAFTRIDRASVDPVISQQMAIIAEGMMEEILSKDFGNSAGDGPAARIAATKVSNYAGYKSTGIVDVEGNAIAGLSSYSVVVAIAHPAGANVLQSVPANDTWRIEVTVGNKNISDTFKLVGWRTKPPGGSAP
jgi:MSHA pilin protein MshD